MKKFLCLLLILGWGSLQAQDPVATDYSNLGENIPNSFRIPFAKLKADRKIKVTRVEHHSSGAISVYGPVRKQGGRLLEYEIIYYADSTRSIGENSAQGRTGYWCDYNKEGRLEGIRLYREGKLWRRYRVQGIWAHRTITRMIGCPDFYRRN